MTVVNTSSCAHIEFREVLYLIGRWIFVVSSEFLAYAVSGFHKGYLFLPNIGMDGFSL